MNFELEKIIILFIVKLKTKNSIKILVGTVLNPYGPVALQVVVWLRIVENCPYHSIEVQSSVTIQL